MDRETKLGIFSALFVGSILAANLMGNKIAHFWFFDAAVAIMVFPLSFLCLDVIQEVDGGKTARRLVWGTLVVLAFVLLVTWISTQLPSAQRDFFPAEYNKIFGISIRVMIASLIAFAVAELSDIEIFKRLKEWSKEKMLWLRATGSTMASQFIDTTVFLFLAFYGISPKHDAAYLILLVIPYWAIKCIIALFGTPLVYAGVRWIEGGKK